MSDETYHCCRYCKHLSDGKCINKVFGSDTNDYALDSFWEDGTLSEAIKEGFSGKNMFSGVDVALAESGLSNKKREKIITLLKDELQDLIDNWIDSIDEQVSDALKNFDFCFSTGVKINDPEKFYCKHYE